jgi:hypothetical protein
MDNNSKRHDRKRTASVQIMLTDDEREEIRNAAFQVGMAISVFVRVMALEAARRRAEKAA